jgi:hypothetical protein
MPEVTSSFYEHHGGKTSLRIQGKGLSGASTCDLLFFPPLFESVDYKHESNFPLMSDELIIVLNPGSSRVRALTSLRVFAVSTGSIFVLVGSDGDGVEATGAIEIHKEAAHGNDNPTLKFFEAVISDVKVLLNEFRALKDGINRLCEQISKTASSTDLLVAARAQQNTGAQLPVL